MAARLPPGMTGIEALQSENTREPEWAERMGEGHAGDHYLRCSAPDKNVLTLNREAWRAFKEAGGTTYLQHIYTIKRDKATNLVQEMVRDRLIDHRVAAKIQRILIKEYS